MLVLLGRVIIRENLGYLFRFFALGRQLFGHHGFPKAYAALGAVIIHVTGKNKSSR